MASEFIGFTILVTLRNPHNAQIQGIVADVVDQKLCLQDVLLLWNGQRLPSYILDAGAIADVEVASEQHLPHVPTTRRVSDVDLTTPTAGRMDEREEGEVDIGRNTQTQMPQRKQTAFTTPFVDPAILSFSKPPTSQPSQPASLQPVSPIMIADGVIPSPLSQVDVNAASGSRRVAAKQSSVSSIGTTLPKKGRQRRDSQATAVLTEPFDAMALEGEVSIDGRKVGEKKRVGGGKGHKSAGSLTAPGVIDVKDVNGPVSGMKTGKKQQQQASTQVQGKGKGWRQTPLIEEIPKHQQAQPKDRRRGRRQPQPVHEDANGWATEDATDIQDLGDFDFASNLSKFNKRQVFDDIRRDDTTADEERLVSFNRLPKAKPGTNGGRNLHWTENVLDSPPTTAATVAAAPGSLHPPHTTGAETWNSEAGETENENEPYSTPLLEEHYSSGRGSRRAGSRRPMQSRKGSTLLPMIERVASPRPSQFTKAPAANTTSPMNGSIASTGTGVARGGLRLPNGKPCHCVSPLQMLEIEQLCVSEGGLSEDVLSENAGRSIAEAIFKSTSTSGSKREATEVKNILFIVGNHKSGARAIVAARHLRNRRLRVTVVVLGGEREDTLLASVRSQLAIYRRGGGWVQHWDDFLSTLPSSYAVRRAGGSAGENGNTPSTVVTRPRTGLGGNEGKDGYLKLDVIVDALLGVHVAFDELRTDDQASCFQMIRWANRSSSPPMATKILSVDVPSGVSATSGLSTEAEGQFLVMQSHVVVALGAPKTGLLLAMGMRGVEEQGWGVLVADMGISSAAWAKHGSRRSKGVEFGGEWVVGLRYVGA